MLVEFAPQEKARRFILAQASQNLELV